MDEPSDDEVMRQLEKARPVQGGLPMLREVQRNHVRIIKELIADYIDPPRVYPLLGPARLHHVHYKCIVYYNEIIHVGWPVPTPRATRIARKWFTSTTTTCTWSAIPIRGQARVIPPMWRRQGQNKQSPHFQGEGIESATEDGHMPQGPRTMVRGPWGFLAL